MDVQNSVGISYWYPGTLSAFAANFDFSHAAACLALTATSACGTRCFMSEHVERAGDLVSHSLPFPVANWTLPIARGVTSRAGLGGHTAPPNSFGDSDLVSHGCQTSTLSEEVEGRQLLIGRYVC